MAEAWQRWALFWCAMLLMAALAGYANGLGRVDRALEDLIASLDRRPVSPDVLIVEIDDASLVALGRWPWPRAVHAPLIDRLSQSGARAIGLHLMLPLSADADAAGDARLAEAMARAGNVVLPLHARWPEALGAEAGLPSAALKRQARGLGHIHLNVDSDGVVRSVRLREGTARQLWDHLVFALLSVAGEAPDLSHLPGAHPSAVRDAPALAESLGWKYGDQLLIPYAGPPGRVARVSYIDVLLGRVAPERLRGRFVLVGPTATSLGVGYATPTQASDELMPAVEVSAQLLDAQLQGVQLRPATAWQNALFSALPVLVAALVLIGWSPRRALWSLLAQALLLVASAWCLRRYAGIQVAPLAGAMALLLVYPLWAWWRLSTVVHYLGEQVQRVQRDNGLLAEPAIAAAKAGDALERHMRAMAAGVDQLNALTVVQRQRDEALGFLSHDLRAPNSAILNLLELHRLVPGRDPLPLLPRIEAHARRALGLADDFVQLMRAQSAAYAFETIDLNDVLIEAVDRHWEQAHARSVTVLTDTLDTAACCHGDRELLTRAVANLIDNGLKYGPPGGELRCAVAREGDRFVISVRDQGPGVAPEHRAGLFDAFRRLDGQAHPSGSGLGLAFVQAVAARHGGAVRVLGGPGEGALFCLALPAGAGASAESSSITSTNSAAA